MTWIPQLIASWRALHLHKYKYDAKTSTRRPKPSFMLLSMWPTHAGRERRRSNWLNIIGLRDSSSGVFRLLDHFTMVGPLSWDLEVLRPERLQTQRCSGRKVLRVESRGTIGTVVWPIMVTDRFDALVLAWQDRFRSFWLPEVSVAALAAILASRPFPFLPNTLNLDLETLLRRTQTFCAYVLGVLAKHTRSLRMILFWIFEKETSFHQTLFQHKKLPQSRFMTL